MKDFRIARFWEAKERQYAAEINLSHLLENDSVT